MDRQTLYESLLRAVASPSGWQAALEHLCEYVGADKALISLRDLKTARITIPRDVSEELASPLIYGFDKVYVEAFLADFEEEDPWTRVERENHPYFPYSVSRYFPRDALRRSPFWDWLSPQGIDDSVVVEIDATSGHWTALNLYFDSGGTPERGQEIVRRVTEILPLVKSAWAAGRQLQVAQAKTAVLDVLIGAVASAAALVDRDGVILAFNDPMGRLLEAWDSPKRPGVALALPSNVPLSSGTLGRLPDFPRGAETELRLQAHVKAFHSTELAGGEIRDILLVSVESQPTPDLGRGQAIWEAPSLTDRERTLVRHVAQGRKFREAQEAMGLSYARVMQLWRSARTKLCVTDVNDLRLTHRLRGGENDGL